MKDRKLKKMNRERKNINRFIRHHNSFNTKATYRKMVVLGSTNSGKTTLINKFITYTTPTDDELSQNEYLNRDYLFKGHNLNLDIVDVPSISSSSVFDNIETADVILLCYEYNNLESVEAALNLYVTIREIRADKMPFVLVGTKSDLKTEKINYKNVNQSEVVADKLTQIKGAKHIITSAKYNMNVIEAFEYGLTDVIKTLHTLSMSVQPMKYKHEHDVENEKENRHENSVSCFMFRL